MVIQTILGTMGSIKARLQVIEGGTSASGIVYSLAALTSVVVGDRATNSEMSFLGVPLLFLASAMPVAPNAVEAAEGRTAHNNGWN